MFHTKILSIALMLFTTFLAACSSDGMVTGSIPSRVDTAGRIQAVRPPFEIGGRWVLASPGRAWCNVTLGASTGGGGDGSVQPEGGCPGDFYTSRRWVYEPSGLVLRNHTGDVLVTLRNTGPGRFEGQSVKGEPITLTR